MIVIVRHGQDEDNAKGILNGHRDLGLTEAGKAQIKSTATQLLSVHPEVIITSPLKRAYFSAKIISEYLSCKHLKVCPELIERDFGCLTGKKIADIPYYCKQILQFDGVNYFLDAEGSESFPLLLTRAKRVLENLKTTYLSRNIIVVTHGDLAKMICAAHYNWSWKQGLQTHNIRNGGFIYLEDRS
ncbi:histidine phosphatase family protein [Gloeothece verrucosa]|uniref:Phosphoglycerate mutase n=1 Tax=Gloeothece verrucosa (strain PCC 7822) TaxID=497965 RepID=E0UMY9_GLOV7|nr:histidine phosphatase family protein [Gloeothece verrucosa]ADN18319.1 Phosphoglycerate mutase [Gloeothece verrucosa PCC 7822]